MSVFSLSYTMKRGNTEYTIIGSLMLHCNFGWEGIADGWYAQGDIFKPLIPSRPNYYKNKIHLLIQSQKTQSTRPPYTTRPRY